jgi:hypothetical protein
MLGSFVREGMNDVEIENGALNFAAKIVLPEIVDAVEIFGLSLVGAGTYNYVVEKRAERKAKEMVEAQKAEEKKNEEAEVVDKDGKPVK